VSDPGSAGSGHPAGLWPVPGEGVLARHGNLILLSSLEQGQLVDMLLDLLEQTAAAGGDGRQFADQIASVVESADSGEASVLAFGVTPSGLAVTVSGTAWADVTTAHGTQRIAGQSGMLLRSLLRSPVSVVSGGLNATVTGPASTDRFSRLDAGTVRANGLSFYAGGVMTGGYVYQPPAQVQQPQPVPQAQPAAPPQPQPPPAPEPQRGSGFEVQSPAQPQYGAVQPQYGVAPGQVQAPPPPQPASAPPPASFERQQYEAQPAQAAEQVGTELWQPPPVQPQPVQPPPVQPPPVQPPPGPPPGLPGGLAQGPGAQYTPAEQFESVLLLDAPGGGLADLGVEQRAPLSRVKDAPAGTSYSSESPIIQGVYCKNGHFDDPEALFCAVCGISMNQQTLINRPGTRPPLGVLLLDDGSVFQLDRDYIVGREPGLDATVASGRSRPLRIADDSGIVSRVHAKVALDGWRVLVTDLGSANGTKVRLPKNAGEQVLQPHQPFVLTTGSQVDLGGRGFRYESHRGR